MYKTILEVADIIKKHFEENYTGVIIAPNSKDSLVVYGNRPEEVIAIEIWKDEDKERNVLMNIKTNKWIETEFDDSKEIIIESLLNIV